MRAGAEPFGNIDQLLVMNGTEGLSQALTQILGQAGAGLEVARKVLGGAKPEAPAPAAQITSGEPSPARQPGATTKSEPRTATKKV